MTKWNIRSAKPEDISFIYATWLNSFYSGSDFSKNVRKTTFMKHYKNVLDELLLHSKTIVATQKEDPDLIVGYLVYGTGVAHYLFVKDIYRKFGVAKDLLKYANLDNPEFTHLTQKSKVFKNRNFNPFYLYKGVSNG